MLLVVVGIGKFSVGRVPDEESMGGVWEEGPEKRGRMAAAR